jgi:DNA-binding GntR family transcriptional regulator
MASSFNEHQAIVDAILKGDSDLASALLRSHVTVQGERFADLVATMRDFKAGT